MINTAVIMAAGLGSRFGNRTELIPKSFIDVSGKSMILRSIELLLSCGIDRIIIGTGYKKEAFEELSQCFPQVECCYSELYATTNSMQTLYNCKNIIGISDFLLLESDIVYEQNAIAALLEDSHPNALLAANETKFQDQYFVEYNLQGNLINCSTDRFAINICGELVGIHKISNSFYQELCQYYQSLRYQFPKMGYEFGLLYVSQYKIPLFVLKVDNLKWYEIDDEADLSYVIENKIIF